ncbi:hypothetical protein ATI61_109204 [Archangium gephyra]|uniref:Nodulation protein noeA n=2 Tax=Archangium gephyra TaxID=48 RepID=A0AAC8Q246_9BACT|nr:hypothetical protein [Archangium gephyra]AKI99604.1 Nodulation protein noeA [Archangium gephyra]REG27863.1 hypothetical protein ATI61_109204 [Archangium gephyra]
MSMAERAPRSPGDPAPLPEPASFRDPSGFVFRREGIVYRQVNDSYREDYELLQGSGLHAELVQAGQLIPHEEVEPGLAAAPGAYKVLRPRQLPFVSYPYEWSFSQLQDAALLTLDVQDKALARGLSLKDASAYNVQLVDGRPMLIDTLSFEKYEEGRPWVAYRQFCQHFLAPLALMSHTDVRLGQLLRLYIDGIPLDLASRLLPGRTRFSFALGMHVHAHARSQLKYADKPVEAARPSTAQFSKHAFRALVASLRNAILKQQWTTPHTEWADYYEANNNYGAKGLDEKGKALEQLLEQVRPGTVWDLGANTGVFSRVASKSGARVVAWDIDPNAVEFNYRRVRDDKDPSVLPLQLDLTNPSPGLGWANAERGSLAERGPVDLVMALGLIHHLAISNNVPLDRVAGFLATLGHHLVLEFVPKEDSQVVKLLATRKDVFPTYHRAGFEAAFAPYFTTLRALDIPGTRRTLFLMKRLPQER